MCEVLKECGYCGASFKPRNRGRDANKFCSRECGLKGQRRRYEGVGDHCVVYFKQCAACGKPFVARRSLTPVCSEECRKEIARRKTRARSAGKKEITETKCKGCGALFTPEYGNKKRMFCSTKCLKSHGLRVGKSVRRARIRGASAMDRIDPLKVFERDGWKCKLCGTPTPLIIRGFGLPNSPELDHIVPVSKGGAHTYANTQCLCRACNQAKGNK